MTSEIQVKTFVPYEVFRANCYRAARYAVMGPILRRRSDQLSDVEDALDNLRKRWRAVVWGLYNEHWEPFHDFPVKAVELLLNCPPFGVRTCTKSWCCKRTSVCPFCYARQRVIRPYLKAAQVLWGPAHDDNPPPGTILVEFTTSISYPLCKFVKQHNQMYRFSLASIVSRIDELIGDKTKRNVEKDSLYYSGCLLNHRLDFNGNKVFYNRSGLIITTERAYTEMRKHPKCSVAAHLPTQENLVSIFGRICHYSARKLNLPSCDLADFLSATSKFRTQEHYGSLRGALIPVLTEEANV